MSPSSDKHVRFTFKVQGSSAAFGVVDFSIDEGISELYQADLTLASEQEISFDDVVGKEALLTIQGDKGDRLFHGIVNRFGESGKKGRFSLYSARLVPQLWLLSQRQNSRIFQNKSVKDIITDVAKAAQLPADRVVFRLQDAPKPREFCVQYAETDLNFVSRLLEEEGIWYLFEQAKDKHGWVMADARSAYKPIDGGSTITYKQAGGMASQEEVVFQFTLSKSIGSGKVSLGDYSYNKPSLDLKAQEQGKEHDTLEVYEHPGRYEDPQVGKKLSKIRLQEVIAMQERGDGASTCARLTPGFTFKIDGMEAHAFNREYLIIHVHHQGTQTQVLQETIPGGGSMSYSNQFTVVPSDVVFRPARDSEKPWVQGPQTAIVVGPDSEEIYTDDHGRVKVKFHWDRSDKKDETVSCWIRVAQIWTGEGWGSMFIPRKGQEVIVSFINGDPDRPIITGRVYNGANPPPHALPGDKTKSTIMTHSSKGGSGANELTFQDAKGSEQVFLHAQKDLQMAVENDTSHTIGHDFKEASTHDKTVTVGNDLTQTVTHDKKETISHDETQSITNDKTHTIGHDKKETITNDSSSKVGQNFKLEAGKDISVDAGQKYNQTVGNDFTSKVTGASSVTVMHGSSEHVLLQRTLNVGGAYNVDVIGAHSVNVGGVMGVTVVGMFNLAAAKAAEEIKFGKSTSAGGAYGITSKGFSVNSKADIMQEAKGTVTIKADGDSIELKCGKASIKLENGGDVTINGAKFTVTASGAVKIDGDKVHIK